MAEVRIGTVDLPERMERSRYFRELEYLEFSGLFNGPLKPSALTKWASQAPRGSIGLVAPWVLTHRKPPTGPGLWPHDATVGDFRDSVPGRAALAQFRVALDQLGARCAVFRSPPLFAASATNRDALKKFFGELATEETLGVPRVWIPDGLWDLRTAIVLATELNLQVAFDPLVRAPGEPPEVYDDLDVTALYLRPTGLGRAGPIRSERMDDLAILLEAYEDVPTTIAFESPARWADARNLKKSLEGALD